MQYYFQQEFIDTVASLQKKKSYKNCENALIESVFKLPKEELFTQCSANRLNASENTPIVKLRVASGKGKSSSFRLYFFVVIKDEKFYFGHIYPKTGSKGKESLSPQKEISVIKTLLAAVKNNSMFEVILDKNQQKICFKTAKKKPVWT